MYVDWEQISTLPKIDNFIDIGVGQGTQLLWKKFKNKKIICIDPLDYSENIVKQKLKKNNYSFYKYAHWNNAEIGSHLKFYRKPNVLERNIHSALIYFHC